MKAVIAFITAILVTASFNTAVSQESKYRFDIGAGIGMSGYLGDTNNSNPFKHPGIAAGASFRYIIDARWAIATRLNAVSLSGNSSGFDIVYPEGQTYQFKSWVYDLGVRGEFNFFSYGMGQTYKKMRRWSPFLSLGIGACMSTTDGKNAFAFDIPMGLGIKYKLAERLNLGLEFSMHKVFSDKIDNITDPYKINSSFGKNTDWFSTIMLSISYEFGERCETCHYVD